MKRRKRARARPVKIAPPGPARLHIGTKEVDDPFGTSPGHKLLVDINRNEDVIEGLLSRRHLTIGRYQIAMRFRALYERASIGSVPAIDYSRPHVSGGMAGDIFTDDLIEAGQELARVSIVIGQTSVSFLSQLVGVGADFGEVADRYARAYGMPDRAARAFVRGRLCEALDLLGDHWRMGEARRPARRPKLAGAGQSPVATEALNRDEFIVVNDMRED